MILMGSSLMSAPPWGPVQPKNAELLLQDKRTAEQIPRATGALDMAEDRFSWELPESGFKTWRFSGSFDSPSVPFDKLRVLHARSGRQRVKGIAYAALKGRSSTSAAEAAAVHDIHSRCVVLVRRGSETQRCCVSTPASFLRSVKSV